MHLLPGNNCQYLILSDENRGVMDADKFVPTAVLGDQSGGTDPSGEHYNYPGSTSLRENNVELTTRNPDSIALVALGTSCQIRGDSDASCLVQAIY
jgi:hypothetical protein